LSDIVDAQLTGEQEMSDILQFYDIGLDRLLGQMSQAHQDYNDVLVYQARMWENIELTRKYGDTETRRADRAEIVDHLNVIALQALKKSFNDLCKLGYSSPTLVKPVRPAHDFLTSARWYTEAVQNLIQYTYNLFNKKMVISLTQCNHAIDLLRQIGKPLLPDYSVNSPFVSDSYGPLEVKLKYIYTQVNTIRDLLIDFSSISRATSKRVQSQRQEIRRKLESLVQSLKQASISINSLEELIDQSQNKVPNKRRELRRNTDGKA
jgi:hypothetical protein